MYAIARVVRYDGRSGYRGQVTFCDEQFGRFFDPEILGRTFCAISHRYILYVVPPLNLHFRFSSDAHER